MKEKKKKKVSGEAVALAASIALGAGSLGVALKPSEPVKEPETTTSPVIEVNDGWIEMTENEAKLEW